MPSRWILGAVVASGCVTPTKYVLKVDAEDKTSVQLCETPATEDQREVCRPYGGQSVNAPAILAVKIENADAGKDYKLNLALSERAEYGLSPADVLGEVLSRSVGIAGNFVESLSPAASEDVEKTAARSFLSKLVDTYQKSRPRIAKAIRDYAQKFGPSAAEPRDADPKLVFKGWVKERKIAGPAPDPKRLLGGREQPPIRTYPLEPRDLLHLESQKVDIGGVVDLTVEWCSIGSFGNIPYDGFTRPWIEFESPTEEQILSALLLDESKLRRILTERELPELELSNRIESLVRSGTQKLNADPPQKLTAAEQAIHSLFNAAAVDHAAMRCRENVSFLLEQAEVVPAIAKRSADLQKVAVDLDALRATLVNALEAFELYIQPLLVQVSKDVLEGRLGDTTVTFAPITLRPGTINLNITSSGASDLDTLGQYEIEVTQAGRVAVGIGPVVTFCRKCIRRVDEAFVPADDGMIASRQLRLVEDSTATAPAVVVHLTLADLSPSQLGIMLGYPLDDALGTFRNILIGASYRHTVGFVVSIGAQVFEATQLKDAYRQSPFIDGSMLTIDDVTTTRPGGAGFFFVGLTTDAFGRL